MWSGAAVVGMRRATPPNAPRIEPRLGAADAPERLDPEVLGHAAIADDAHDPGENEALELPEERLEGLEVTSCEALQQVRWLIGFAASGLSPLCPRALL